MAGCVAPADGCEVQLLLVPLPPVPSCQRELHDLGVEVMHAWTEVGEDPSRPLCSQRDVFAWCSKLSDPSLHEALALIASQLDAVSSSDLYVAKLKRDIGMFISTLHALGVPSLRDVNDEHLATFLHGPVRGRGGRDDLREPSSGVVFWRRTAVRACYLVARHLGLAEGDPSLDIKIEPRSSRVPTRRLTDDEELLGRIACRMSFVDTRGPSIWALGQATAMPAEMGRVAVEHIDLDGRRVWLVGTKDRRPRYGYMTDWGVTQLAERIAEVGDDPDRLVVYDGRGGGSRADSSITNKLVDIFVYAGIREPGVRPASLVAWAGRQVFDQQRDISAAARAMGIDSLDRAAKLIGWEWLDAASI